LIKTSPIGAEKSYFSGSLLIVLSSMLMHTPKLSQRIASDISDIEMPEMDGYTLTSEIRRDPV
jgi:CheY-like chemotaxis protein